MKPCMIILYLENIHLNSTSFITSNKHQTVSNLFSGPLQPMISLLKQTQLPNFYLENVSLFGGNVTQDRINHNFHLRCCHFLGGGWLIFSTRHCTIIRDIPQTYHRFAWFDSLIPKKKWVPFNDPLFYLGLFFKKPSFHYRFAKLHDRICHFDLQVTVEPAMWCITSSLRVAGLLLMEKKILHHLGCINKTL